VVYGFPATLGESIKINISVKSRDQGTQTKTGTKDHRQKIRDGGSRHFEKTETVLTQ
jgi:hypothetical protein